MVVHHKLKNCILYFDGACSKNEGGAKVVISNDQGESFKKAIKLAFPCSNNQTEYEALAIRLHLAKEMKISGLKICGDSNLIIKKVGIEFIVKDLDLAKYRDQNQRKLQGFENYELEFL